MIKSFYIKETKEKVRLKPSGVIEANPHINIIVGHNGSGKTTLLRELFVTAASHHPDWMKKKNGCWEYLRYEGKKTSYVHLSMTDGGFGFPTIWGSDNENVSNKSWFGDDMVGQICAMKASHGQGLTVMLTSRLKKASPRSIIFLDQPEDAAAGTMIANIMDLVGFLIHVKRCQVWMVTHSPHLALMSPRCILMQGGVAETVDSKGYVQHIEDRIKAHPLYGLDIAASEDVFAKHFEEMKRGR